MKERNAMIRKVKCSLKNTFFLFCPFLILSTCSNKYEEITISNSLSHNIGIEHLKESLLGSIESLQKNYQIKFTSRSCNNSSALEIHNDDIQIPQSVGQYTEDCHENPNYNACIYDYNPFIRNGSLIPEFKDIFEIGISLKQSAANGNIADNNQWMEDYKDNRQKFNEAMRFYQTYAVNITGATDGLLKNEHYDVIRDTMRGSTRRLRQQPDGKWTTPYLSIVEYLEVFPNEPAYQFSVEQVMAYYYLMYQKEWMELNTGRWYASRKNISLDFTGVFLDEWVGASNKIILRIREKLFSNIEISSSFHAFSPVHEAGHANFYYSNLSRTGSKDKTHRGCGLRGMCCTTSDGCLIAINEGQADFHGFMLFPDSPVEVPRFPIKSFLNRETLRERGENIQSPFLNGSGGCDILREHRANRNLTSEDTFNCQSNSSGKGEVHSMGALYASIWWEIYNHEDTSKKDIATLFTEHLPLVSNDDTFKTVAVKIINKVKELFDGAKGDHYDCLISQEFARRRLSPSSQRTQ